MVRVSIDDLAFAADWLEGYDPSPDDEANGERAIRVAKWLKAQIEQRQTESIIRAAQREGVSRKMARRVLEQVPKN